MGGLTSKFKMSPGRGAPLVSCLYHFFMNAKTTLIERKLSTELNVFYRLERRLYATLEVQGVV